MWDSFQDSKHEFVGTPNTIGLAGEVLTSFGIPNDVSGGILTGVNIKNADPMSVIKASLLEEFASGVLKEIRVTAEGEVVEYIVGNSYSNLYIYYSTRSKSYKPDNVGVQVTGKKPRPTRVNMGWQSVIGEGKSTVHDVTALSSSCLSTTMSSVAIITYKDPILTSGKGSYRDGVDNLFELNSVWESIVGFAWQIDPGETNEFTTIKQSSISNIPVLVSSSSSSNDYTATLGTLSIRGIIEGDDCFVAGGEDVVGIPVQVSLAHLSEGVLSKQYGDTEVNTFTALTGVYVVAVNLYKCSSIPKDTAAIYENNKANSKVILASNDMTDRIYKLSESEEYTVNYEGASGTDVAKIQLAQNTTKRDFGDYGTSKEFIIQSTSDDLIEHYDQQLEGIGSIMPTKNNGGGLLVKQLWAEVVLDSPCFIISDPTGDAKTIADNFKASLTAIVINEEPVPIAINGELIDQSEGIADNDPSTAQDFSETSLEQAMKKMKGRTLSIGMSSLDAEGVTSLSNNLYNLLKINIDTYTHICSPNSTPTVGSSGKNGGIINKINYSYQDQGSYLITITEGPESFGDFSGINSGIYKKRSEEVTGIGTVIQHDGSHIYFKVNVDGVGPVIALNAYPGVIDIKDRVTVSIHNNPVES